MTKTLISLFSALRMPIIAVLTVCMLSSSAFAAVGKLMDVRVGTHRQHDRLVMEIDNQVQYHINTDNPDKITVRLFNTNASNTFVLPDLKKNLMFIKGVEAYLIGNSDIEIDIVLGAQSDYKLLELAGSPWRLVVDFSEKEIIPPVDASKPVKQEEPEYVPGDKPIETRYAEDHSETKDIEASIDTTDMAFADEVNRVLQKIDNSNSIEDSLSELLGPLQPDFIESFDEHIGTNYELAESYPEPEETDLDPETTNRINTVLRHYYLAIGDTDAAVAFGYPNVQDQFMTEELETAMQNAGISVTLAALIYRMPWMIFVAAFLTGTIGGILGYFILSRSSSIKLPKRKPKAKKEKTEAVAEEPEAEQLEQDMDSLESAVELEPQTEPEEDLVPEPEPVIEAEEGAEAEAEAPADEELKETAMERRVKRVLDLSKGGADIESIAKQLEMSQDEVKLILDLN